MSIFDRLIPHRKLFQLAYYGPEQEAVDMVRCNPSLALVRRRGTPLIEAAVIGVNEKLVKCLLENGADPDAMSVGCNYPSAPLHWMASHPGPLHYSQNPKVQERCARIARLLLEHGASVNLENAEGHTPLWLAVRADNVPVAKVLLAYRADVRGVGPPGSSEMAKMLRERGARSV